MYDRIPRHSSNDKAKTSRKIAVSLWKLATHTALEIGPLLVLWQVADRVVKGLSVKRQQVADCISP